MPGVLQIGKMRSCTNPRPFPLEFVYLPLLLRDTQVCLYHLMSETVIIPLFSHKGIGGLHKEHYGSELP